MDADKIPEYTEEIETGRLKQEQFLTIAKQAMEYLRWPITSTADNTITCHTRGVGNAFGELITVKAEQGKAIFHSKPVNEYYWADNQNATNAELFKKAIAAAVEKNKKAERNLSSAKREKFGALIPSKTYLVTPLLVYINVLVFTWMLFLGISPLTPSAQSLLACGGNFRPLTTNGNWWRLLTYMFLHAGILHLLMNMYALLYIGMFLEPLLGKFRFAAAYLLTGVCAGLMSVAIHPYTVGVGASGAIFGMYGVFLAMLTTKHIEKTVRNTMLRSILFFVVLNLLYGAQGNIDNAAHVGGLLSGIAVGYAYYPGVAKYHSTGKQVGVTIVIATLVVLLSIFTLPRLTNDMLIYEQKIKRFAELESKALDVYKMDKNAPKDDILYSIRDKGIYYWNEDIKILEDLKKLDLPATVKEKNNKLLQYCKLRIEVYELLYKGIKEGKDTYSQTINDDNLKISKILEDLKGK